MFYDREKERKELLTIVNTEPSLIYFIYGPINSGKTNLINNILEDLPEDIVPFSVDLRGRTISSSDDFLNVLFSVERKSAFDKVREYLKELFKGGADIVKQHTGIPVPKSIFDVLFNSKDKGGDAFKYLEGFFTTLVKEKKLKPVFILDELQMIKEIVNSKGSPLLDNLFNFFVRMTKATHLCHCFAVSSDSVFIERIHGSARLEGRSQYILIDDLDDKDRAIEVYDKFGFKDKERVWSFVGGKFGDMVVLQAWLQRGRGLAESLDMMLEDQVGRLKLMKAYLLEEKDKQSYSKMMDLLFHVGREGSIPFQPEKMRREVYYWVDKNVLFLDPFNHRVKAQGQLIHRAINALE